MTTAAGSANFNGGGSGAGYVPTAKRKQIGADTEDSAPKSTTPDSGGGGAFRQGAPRSDVQEILLLGLQEPFKSALSKLMNLLETVNNVPHDVRIAIVAGPLGYMSNLNSVRPTPFLPTPTILRPVIR